MDDCYTYDVTVFFLFLDITRKQWYNHFAEIYWYDFFDNHFAEKYWYDFFDNHFAEKYWYDFLKDYIAEIY